METDFVSLRQMDVAEGVRGGGGGVLGSRDPVGRPPLKNVPGNVSVGPFQAGGIDQSRRQGTKCCRFQRWELA